MILAGGREAWKLKDTLAEEDIPKQPEAAVPR